MGLEFEEWPMGPAMAVPAISNGRHSMKAPSVDVAEATPAPEDEIGTVLLRVQQFADESANEARRTAQVIIEDARTEAHRIVTESRQQAVVDAEHHAQIIIEEARRQSVDQAEHHAQAVITEAQTEANRIIEEARRYSADAATVNQSLISPDAIANLTAAIGEFAGTNRSLVEELVHLRDALAAPKAGIPLADLFHAPVAQPPH